jgi:hypothetical protein
MPILPEPYLSIFVVNNAIYYDERQAPEWLQRYYSQVSPNESAKLKPAQKQRIMAGSIIAERLIDDHNHITPASVKKAAEATAKEWKLKLPKNWNIAPNTAPSPKEKKGYEK